METSKIDIEEHRPAVIEVFATDDFNQWFAHLTQEYSACTGLRNCFNNELVEKAERNIETCLNLIEHSWQV